eukprot:TRINITY_DN7118_c0_g1_i1.p1 TRINITY_DN7118_c0_g1~~TRINITY_DN7118_c0_g1_i1.p1  ORF type:complete len:457 (+),score=91.30 TRINITY_DN7118_c0_g1_i1:71-1441(+)
MKPSIILTCFALIGAAQGVAKPSAKQLGWMDLEVGAMITWNLQTYCMEENNPGRSSQKCQSMGYVPSLKSTAEWNPYALDTDKWVEIASSFGAKYIVLVADHMTGFTLWDTKLHNFSIAHTKWKGGGGDLVKDFLTSCEKYNMKPGFFYSSHYNWFLGVNDFKVGWPPLGGVTYTQEQYNDIVGKQLRELYGYKGAYEVWYDGGVDTVLTPSVPQVVSELVPDALCHSCVNFSRDVGLRWMGNEEGVMPLPSWGASNGTVNGDPHSVSFMPPSADTVLREHYWFWWNNTENTIKSTTKLVSNYLTSVGRASNLILNMAPDSTGAVPQADVTAYAKFGAAIKCLFSDQIYDVNITAPMQPAGTGWAYTFTVPATRNMSFSVMEDQTAGQVVNEWHLSAGGLTVLSSTGIGHKRIVNIASEASGPVAYTLTVSSSFEAVPKLRRITAYNWVGKELCDN